MTSPIDTNNVVERLRLVRDHTYLADAEAMCEEAADEIEWLRSGRQSLSDRIDVLEGQATFLCERLRDFSHEVDASDTEDIYREFHGHVAPALARLEASLTQGGNTNG